MRNSSSKYRSISISLSAQLDSSTYYYYYMGRKVAFSASSKTLVFTQLLFLLRFLFCSTIGWIHNDALSINFTVNSASGWTRTDTRTWSLTRIVVENRSLFGTVAERDDRWSLRWLQRAGCQRRPASRSVASAKNAARMRLRNSHARESQRRPGVTTHRDVQQRLRHLLQPSQSALALLHAEEYPRRAAGAGQSAGEFRR